MSQHIGQPTRSRSSIWIEHRISNPSSLSALRKHFDLNFPSLCGSGLMGGRVWPTRLALPLCTAQNASKLTPAAQFIPAQGLQIYRSPIHDQMPNLFPADYWYRVSKRLWIVWLMRPCRSDGTDIPGEYPVLAFKCVVKKYWRNKFAHAIPSSPMAAMGCPGSAVPLGQGRVFTSGGSL